MDYYFDVEHVSGASNAAADALSRLIRDPAACAVSLSGGGASPDGGGSSRGGGGIEADHSVAIAQVHGHFGVGATLRRLREAGHTWPGMKESVMEFIVDVLSARRWLQARLRGRVCFH